MNATDFMKKQNAAWDELNPNPAQKAKAPAIAGNSEINMEFSANRFATRSKRLNTNTAKQPVQIPSSIAVNTGMPPPTIKSQVPSSGR